MFDISDSSSRSQTQCLWHILALLYPHPLPRASKWDTSAESKNHRPSPQTERFVCGAVIGKQIDGENIKSIAFTWLLFKMLILAKQMLLISFFFSLSLFLFVCKKKCKKKEALGFSIFKTKYNNNSFNDKYWLWASIKEEACHKCGFMEMNGAFLIPFIVYLPEMRRVGGEASPGITAVITYLLHGHACQFRVQLFFSVTPLWMKPANNMEMCLWKMLELQPLIFSPSRAWTAQVPSHPFHCVAAGHQPRAAASPKPAFHVAPVLRFFPRCWTNDR